jgi:hypothetical protein
LLARYRVTIDVDEKPREVFQIFEHRNEELRIVSRLGTKFGLSPDGAVMMESRYSIHPSKRSPKYSTVKNTIRYGNEEPKYTVALTAAVKSSGFSMVFVNACPDLRDDRYRVPEDNKAQLLAIGTYDPATQSLVCGLFIGNRESKFPPDPNNWPMRFLVIGNLKLVLLFIALAIPSGPIGFVSMRKTYAPEEFDDENVQENLWRLMEGQEPAACRQLFAHCAANHGINYLEYLRKSATDPAQFELVDRLIAELRPQLMPTIRHDWIDGTTEI